MVKFSYWERKRSIFALLTYDVPKKTPRGGVIGVNANLETKCAKCGSLNKYCNHT